MQGKLRLVCVTFLLLFALILIDSSMAASFIFIHHGSTKFNVSSSSSPLYEICEERILSVISEEATSFNVFLSVNNTSSQEITLLNFSIDLTDISNVIIENLSAPLQGYWVEVGKYESIIHIKTSILPGQIANFSLNFTSKQGILASQDYAQFLFAIKMRANVKKFTFQVRLPAGSYLYTKMAEPVYPEPSENFTDGEHIFLQWDEENITAGTVKIFVVYYDKPYTSTATVIIPFPLTGSVDSVIVAVLAAAAGLSVAVLAVFLKMRRKGVEASDAILPLLNDAEREILKLLSTSENGMMTQRDIQDATGYSKAKVSVTVSLLERKGLVEKKAKGRTRIVKLKRRIEI